MRLMSCAKGKLFNLWHLRNFVARLVIDYIALTKSYIIYGLVYRYSYTYRS